MKLYLAVIAALVIPATSLCGQTLGNTIYLPGPSGGLTWPQCAAFNAGSNTVCVGGKYGDCVVVIDATTLRKIARVPTGRDVRAVCYDGTGSKVYCANNDANTVTVIDVRRNSVVATVKVGEGPFALAYNPVRNAIYCANFGHYPEEGANPSVTVIDCASDSAVADIRGVGAPFALACNAKHNRVYCTDAYSERVSVIDGSSNTVVAAVPQSGFGGAICYNPANDRVYCSGGTVIDGMTNEITATIMTGEPALLCLDSARNRILCVATYGGITAIDCSTDKLLTSKLGVPTTLFSPSALRSGQLGISAVCLGSNGGRMFCARAMGADLYAVDVQTWTVTDSVKLGGFPAELCCIPKANSVVYYDPYQNTVHWVDADSARRVADVLAGPPLYYDSVSDRVYCGRVTIDPTSGRVLSGFRLSTRPSVMCGNTVGGKLYLVAGDTILALNQATDERTAVSRVSGIGQSGVAPCYEPSTGAMYFAMPQQNALLVIDSRTASVVDTIPLDNEPSYLCSNPNSRKVYSASRFDAGVTVINSVTRKATTTVKLEVPDTTRLVSGTRELIVRTTSGDRLCCLCSVSSDSSVYCAGEEHGLLYVIDGTSDAVVATIPVPPGNHQLLYSAQTNKVYCTNDDNTLSVIDVSSRRVIGRIEVGEGAQAPALNSQSHLLYVPNCFGSSISVIHDE